MPFSIRPYRFLTKANMTKLLALLLAWSLPQITIASEDMASLIGDRQYWEAFQWDKAENSTIWKLQGWEDFTGKQDSNKTFVRERTVFLSGIDFTGSQIKENQPAKMPWTLAISSIKTSAEKCEQIVSWSTSKFGKPKALDTSYEIAFGPSPESQLDNVEKVYGWIVGSTSITVLCGGVVPKIPQQDSDPSFVTLISFTHQTNDKPVTPLFALKCSGKITALVDSSIHESMSFTFFVDTYWGLVRNAKKVPFGTRTSITPDQISFSREKNDLVIDHRINRFTGEYSAEGWSMKTKIPQTRASGECERVTMGPKF